ncbi:rhodanese-like domain-containing protein [Pseudonocardia oroxyli]|uniref:Rhodanese-related sulfurtransferase n=1 Tax=Pseudonocardia oroxyli TaxID=366584 RepID=A0A1G8C6H8_PSEOR|nr:rhodanese-like domain-containing protein [Pseudonocardia oroxyli]SDH40984.1 Rhodanese-related sulfurtransferase [Pseudonocardia oroxyli]
MLNARATLLSPAEAAELVARDEAYLIDIRGAAAREEHGVVPAATVVDRNRLDRTFGRDSAERLDVAADPAKRVIVFCSSERGSGPVAERIARLGYPNVSHIEGGFAGWRAAELPTDAP